MKTIRKIIAELGDIEEWAGGHVKIPNDPYMPLLIEWLGKGPSDGDLVAVSHTYEQNGDLMRDPEIVFLVTGDIWTPMSFRNDSVGVYRESMIIEDGDIRIAIIPDEEIGVGTEKLDLRKFGADVAYTIDGGEIGLIDVESFNGFMGKIEVEGCSAFPGYGKGQYINAAHVLSRFIAAMPDDRWPQNCDGRQPIWWVDRMEGDVASASTAIYLRDFDLDGIKKAQGVLDKIRADVLQQFPKAKIAIDIKES